MPKFYVESGNVQWIVTAKTRRGAALWALHRTMTKVMPFVSGEEEDGYEVAMKDAPRLADEFRVHEQGFGREEADRYDTLDLLGEWSELLVALAKLERDVLGA